MRRSEADARRAPRRSMRDGAARSETATRDADDASAMATRARTTATTATRATTRTTRTARTARTTRRAGTMAMTSSRVTFATRKPRETTRARDGDGAISRGRRAMTRARARGREDETRDPRLISRRDKAANRENAKTWVVVGGLAVAMTAVIALVYENSTDGFLYGVDSIESYASGDGLDFVFASDGGPALSAASVAGAAIWGLALYFASPVSVIMLFLGRTDSERPSDWLLRKVTGIAQMEDASVGAKVAVAAWFLVAGVAASVVGDAAFGDSTWQISSGLGFLTIAGVSELGRPKRVDEATLAKLTAQYDDFCEFAQNRLSRSGRAHQTEISRAFRDAYPQHDESVLDESEFRSLVANWHPAAERSPRGYYKNLSLVKSERVSVKDLGV